MGTTNMVRSSARTTAPSASSHRGREATQIRRRVLPSRTSPQARRSSMSPREWLMCVVGVIGACQGHSTNVQSGAGGTSGDGSSAGASGTEAGAVVRGGTAGSPATSGTGGSSSGQLSGAAGDDGSSGATVGTGGARSGSGGVSGGDAAAAGGSNTGTAGWVTEYCVPSDGLGCADLVALNCTASGAVLGAQAGCLCQTGQAFCTVGPPPPGCDLIATPCCKVCCCPK